MQPSHTRQSFQFLLAALAICVGESTGRCQDGAAERDLDRWIEVPYTGTVSMRRRLDYKGPTHDGKGRAVVHENILSQLTVTHSDEERNDDGTVVGYQPVGFVNGNVNQFWSVQTEDVFMSGRIQITDRIEHTYRPGASWCTLTVNPGRGLFRLNLPKCTFRGGTGTSRFVTEIHNLTGSEEASYTFDVFTDKGVGVIRDHPYTPGAGWISGSCPVTKHTRLPAQGVLEPVPVQFQVSWFLQIGKPPGRVVLEPAEGYDEWMPRLGLGAGHTLAVKARIVEPKGARGRIEFRLEETSREPGECLNHPSKDAGDEPDLVIHPDLNDDLEVAGDGQKAKTRDDVAEVMIVLQAKDWGAYAQLHARAYLLLGGEEVEVPAVYEATGVPYVAVPRDDNSNSIADCWERENEVAGCGGESDDDAEPDGRGNGDGLSAYEEYRGVHVQGQHRRLDPRKKELFVFDPDGLAAASYLEPATRLQVHYVLLHEIGADDNAPADRKRVINFNHDRYHLVDQHGLWVRKATHAAPSVFFWGDTDGKVGPPVNADPHVKVFVDQIRADLQKIYRDNLPEIRNQQGQRGVAVDEAWLETRVQEAIRYVTAHECGHGLFIEHHVKSTMKCGPPRTWSKEGFKTGQLSCVMRYVFHDEEVKTILCGRPFPRTLCDDQINNCRLQMVVSDEGR